MTVTRIVHLADLHFGVHVDLAQIGALERLVPRLEPDAIVVAGDLTQRARHGEFQCALTFAERLRQTAPTLVIPGNHDVSWWASPFHVRGARALYRKYRHYFGDDLTPVLRLPGAVIAGALTSHGVAFGSLTPNPNNMAVMGHLPSTETDRLARIFAEAPAGAARVVVVHHNVLRGEISQRMGLARWASAQRRIRDAGADLVLCGHDHQEGMGQIDRLVTVSTTGTHSSRTRNKRPSVFNVVTIDAAAIHIQHYRWDAYAGVFRAADRGSFARRRHDNAPQGARAAAEARAGV